MLMEVKNNIRYILYAIKCNLLSAVEYKKSFIIQAIFMFINNGFFLIFWNVVFGINGNNINGLEIKDVLYLWSIPTIGFGIAHFVFGGIKNLDRYIISGGLDSFLTQPKNAYINIITSNCDFSAFGDLMYGFCMAAYLSNNIGDFIIQVFYGMIAAVIIVATSTIIRSLSVWIGDVSQMAQTYEHTMLINFATYPEVIYGNVTKFLIYTIMPAGYMVHLPIKLIGNFNIWGFLLILFATIVYVIIAIGIFKKVLNRYESGNSMAMKM